LHANAGPDHIPKATMAANIARGQLAFDVITLSPGSFLPQSKDRQT
jgi:hypothetical protein